MREILFKAKTINRDKGYHRTSYKNGDWACGLVTRLYDERFENLPAEMTDENGVSGIEIDHNTICQYTGLTDKNGNKIWENDVVRIKYVDNFSEVGWVKYSNCGVRYYFVVGVEVYSFDGSCDIEVIGNTFDNPELMKGE